MVEEAFPHLNGKVLINSVGTVIGSHTGPGTLALFFLGSKRMDIVNHP
jgi:fatty acid-binding protein DegV